MFNRSEYGKAREGSKITLDQWYGNHKMDKEVHETNVLERTKIGAMLEKEFSNGERFQPKLPKIDIFFSSFSPKHNATAWILNPTTFYTYYTKGDTVAGALFIVFPIVEHVTTVLLHIA